MIVCQICKMTICKYRLDLGDTIILNVPAKSGLVEFIVCDEYAKKIARDLIERWKKKINI